jgi:uncharacterized protein YycO
MAQRVDISAPMLRLLLVIALFTGCMNHASVLVKRPENKVADAAVTELWTADVKRIARDGDWILSRSYYLTSDMIATFTGGEDLSHASIYDAQRGTVIESVGSGVREISLEQLMKRNAHVIVVHPSGLTGAERTHSVERARSRLGQAFDTGGLIGLGAADKVYCSELVWWASQMELRTGDHQRVITPSELIEYGQVVYWSGERDDAQIQNVALSMR